jgi:hypothetical protein
VEQVALNRHVFAATAAISFMPEQGAGVKSNIYEGKDKGPPRMKKWEVGPIDGSDCCSV